MCFLTNVRKFAVLCMFGTLLSEFPGIRQEITLPGCVRETPWCIPEDVQDLYALRKSWTFRDPTFRISCYVQDAPETDPGESQVN